MTEIPTDITINNFDYKEDTDTDGILYGEYSYNEYSIATKTENTDLGSVISYRLVIRLQVTSVFKISSIDDALVVINIIERGKDGTN